MNIPKKKRIILTYPNPYLREEAEVIELFDEGITALFEEMCDLMHQSEGVGLAATQVGESLQLLVLSSYVFMSEEDRKQVAESGNMGPNVAVINPNVIEQSEDMLLDYEGCLSFPDVYIKVKRPAWVKIGAQNLEGEHIELKGEGFGARAILHEMDHLTGKVMTDHLSFLARQKALKDHQKIQKNLAKKAESESGDPQSNSPTKPIKASRQKGKANQNKKGKRPSKKKR